MRQKKSVKLSILSHEDQKLHFVKQRKKNKRGRNGFHGNCLGKKQLLNRCIQATHKKVASRYDMTWRKTQFFRKLMNRFINIWNASDLAFHITKQRQSGIHSSLFAWKFWPRELVIPRDMDHYRQLFLIYTLHSLIYPFIFLSRFYLQTCHTLGSLDSYWRKHHGEWSMIWEGIIFWPPSFLSFSRE